MKITQKSLGEPIAWDRAYKDIPEIFNIEGGRGYLNVHQGGNAQIDPSSEVNRSGTDGVGRCAALLLRKGDIITLAHVTPQLEGLVGIDLSTQEDALIVKGSGSWTASRLRDELDVQGFKGPIDVYSVNNHKRPFGLVIDAVSQELGLIDRENENPTIIRFDLEA